MRALVICCVSSLLAACSSAPVAPEVVTGHVETVRVPVPTPVACVRAADVPPAPKAPAIAADADVEQLAAWAKLRDQQLRQYASALRAIVIACEGGNEP